MIGWQRTLILAAISITCLVVVSWTLSVKRASQTPPENRASAKGHEMNVEILEREIRNALPPGSSLITVQKFLAKRDLGCFVESRSKTAFSIARDVRGSGWLTSKSLTLQFHFNDRWILRSIDAKVLYTGP
jgi:hypothetical protein